MADTDRNVTQRYPTGQTTNGMYAYNRNRYMMSTSANEHPVPLSRGQELRHVTGTPLAGLSQ